MCAFDNNCWHAREHYFCKDHFPPDNVSLNDQPPSSDHFLPHTRIHPEGHRHRHRHRHQHCDSPPLEMPTHSQNQSPAKPLSQAAPEPRVQKAQKDEQALEEQNAQKDLEAQKLQKRRKRPGRWGDASRRKRGELERETNVTSFQPKTPATGNGMQPQSKLSPNGPQNLLNADEVFYIEIIDTPPAISKATNDVTQGTETKRIDPIARLQTRPIHQDANTQETRVFINASVANDDEDRKDDHEEESKGKNQKAKEDDTDTKATYRSLDSPLGHGQKGVPQHEPEPESEPQPEQGPREAIEPQQERKRRRRKKGWLASLTAGQTAAGKPGARRAKKHALRKLRKTPTSSLEAHGDKRPARRWRRKRRKLEGTPVSQDKPRRKCAEEPYCVCVSVE
jgi:hypothetical protein